MAMDTGQLMVKKKSSPSITFLCRLLCSHLVISTYARNVRVLRVGWTLSQRRDPLRGLENEVLSGCEKETSAYDMEPSDTG